MNWLDLLVSALCGWMAVICFGLFAITSPRRAIWRTWPEYVRKGLLVTGGCFTWRSVNLTSISPTPFGPGHINAEGAMLSLALAYTVTALAYYVGKNHLPERWWERFAWMEHEVTRDPSIIPVMSAPSDLGRIGEVKGATALPPRAGGVELLRALERSPGTPEH